MIVKNESHIIHETLENLIKHIKLDYYVISDTGSTDNTIDVIKTFFNKNNISGEIYQDEWKDFGHNRTKALEYAYNKSDYLLIFDADDLIHGTLPIPDDFNADAYDLIFEGGYQRKCLVSNRIRWKYVGILHEFICNIDPVKTNVFLHGDYYIESRRLGDRNKNPNKYLDDAIILENAYNNESDAGLKTRYLFYCAQSYESNKIEKSIEYYKLYLESDGNNSHKYVVCSRLSNIFKNLQNFEEMIFYCNKSIKYDVTRVDALINELDYYYNNGMYHKLNMIFKYFIDKDILKDNNNKLFINHSNLDRFFYYNSISSYYIGDLDSGYKCCKYLLENNKYVDITISNLIFYKNNFILDNDKDKLIKFFLEFINNKNNSFQIKEKIYTDYLSDDSIFERYNIKSYASLFDQNNITKLNDIPNKNILIYTGYMYFHWNDSTLNNQSIGGAEKAVIYLSRNLPKDYNIFIAGDHIEENKENITYIAHNNLQDFLNTNEFDSIIVSRYVSFFKQFNNIKCNKLFLSAHDSTGFINNHIKEFTVDNILNIYNKDIDHVICLTNWHANNIIENHPYFKNKIKIINNGINISDFKWNCREKIKNKFIWSSCAYRGLYLILNLWNKVLEKIPDATLDICSYETFPKNSEETEMKQIIDKHESIVHHGKLDTNALYDLASKCEYWLYTNTFPETSCITAMEMLMSEVVCLYYPLAGLNDTIGEYGIPVKQGEEIETILNLSTEKKALMREKGKEYALSCSWKNRALEWSSMLGNGEHNNRIGIFNSFPFHYEMFGFILNYAQNNNIEVDIFTNKQNNMGWLDFYKESFSNFNIIDFNNFNGNTNKYSTFFVITDDDPLFKSEWRTDNVICINHYYKTRTPNFKHYLNVANFKDSLLDYNYPCYPLANYQDKIQNNTVCIIGGGYIHTNYNINFINRLQSKKKINLNIFARKLCKTDISEIDTSKFNIHFVEDIETNKMITILKQSSYVFVNYNSNKDHNNGISCSGSLQLALSTLCKPIILKSANQYLQIQNALEFDVNSDEPIVLDEEIDFKAIEEERKKFVNKFYKYIDKFQSAIYLRILSKEGVSNNLETWMNTDNLKYMYNKPVILTNSNNFTHAIIINDYKPKLTIPKENVIGLSHEPNQLLFNFTDNKEIFINYVKQHISHYFIGDQQDLQHPFIEGQTFLLNNKDDFYYKSKYNFCSIVISKKNQGFNYKYRHDLVKAILQTDLPIDIYGYATESEEYKKYNDCRIKHSLEWSEKNPFGTIPFENYKFHICIENIISNNYFSEKITNPLRSNIIPIYYGCKKIDNYFNSVIKLTGDINNDIELLNTIYKNQEQYVNNNSYSDILDKTNIFKNLHNLFDNIVLKNVTEIKVFIIHYKKLTDRKEFILKQFEREQITNYEFITIDRDELNDYDLLKFNKNYSKPLAANFLSHLYAYKQISLNNYKYNLILEDDVILCEGFSNILNSYIKQIPEDFDSVFIGEGCNIQEHHINHSNIIKNKNIYKCDNENKCKCTDSYMISTKCANKLIKYYNTLSTRGYKIDEPIDYFLNKPLKLSDVYWAEPTLIKQGTIIGLFNSSIGNGMINHSVGFNPNVLTCYKSPFKKIRVGKDFDGGYVICDIPNIKYELLLSGGIADDISFEEDFCNKYPNCICNAYDGTINIINFTNKYINFFKKNINNFNDDNNTNLHLDLENHSNIFLKMDIEGYEIPWIKTLKEDHLTRISQIVIEFHFPFNNTEIEVFNKLNKYFKIIHFHANNCCGTRNHNGVIIPNVFECTYLNLNFFNNYYELNTEVIPGVLDMKNVLENNEIIINYEPFVNNLNFKTNFLTFGCDKYTKTSERIKIECKNINIFDNILIRNVDYLKEKSQFWNKHEHFIINNKRGFGYWIWKPFLIYDTLLQMNFNDILVYCDSGCEINQKGKKRLEEYFKIVSNSPYGILSFQMSHHQEYKWTKMDIFKEIDIEICSSNFNSGQLIGGIIIIKKCEHSLMVFKKILEISENYNLINDSQSSLKNHHDFIENRHDQSISSVIRKKYGTEIIEDESINTNNDTIPIYAKRIR